MSISPRRAELKSTFKRKAALLQPAIDQATIGTFFGEGTAPQRELQQAGDLVRRIIDGDKSKAFSRTRALEQLVDKLELDQNPHASVELVQRLRSFVDDAKAYRGYQRLPSYNISYQAHRLLGLGGFLATTGAAGWAVSLAITLPLAGIERAVGASQSGDPIGPMRVPRERLSNTGHKFGA